MRYASEMSVVERGRGSMAIWRRLRDAWRAARTEGLGSDGSFRAQLELRSTLSAELDAHSPVVMQLEPTTMAIDGVLFDDGRDDESIVAPLYADGVRAIELHRGATEDELDSLLELWWAFLLGRVGGEDGFATLAFESEGRSVRVSIDAEDDLTSEDPVSVARRREQIDSLVRSMLAPRLPRSASNARSGSVRAAYGLGQGRDVSAEPLSPRDLADLTSGLGFSGTGLVGLVMLASAIERAPDPIRRSLAVLAFHVLVDLTASADVEGTLTKLSLELGDEALEDELFQASFESEHLAVLGRLLSDRARAPGVRAILSFLRPEDLDLLFSILPDASPSDRIEVGRVVAKMNIAPADLAAFVIGESDEVVLGLFDVVATISDEHTDMLVRACLVSESTKVRARALLSLRPERLSEIRELLELCLSDASTLVQRETVAAIGRAKSDEAVELLARPLQAYSDVELRKSCAKAIGAIGGARASAVLCRTAGDMVDRSVRMAAVEAIGRLSDASSMQFLETLARRTDDDRGVRDAAKLALSARRRS